MEKVSFEDLKVGMFVKTFQSKNITRRIIDLRKEPFHITISFCDAGEKGAEFYSETLHWKNLYQVYIDGKWMDCED